MEIQSQRRFRISADSQLNLTASACNEPDSSSPGRMAFYILFFICTNLLKNLDRETGETLCIIVRLTVM